jgi:sec-independent protein translocase protein TatB
MLTLSPAKILVVLVIALIVLGPEKLPGVARQIGAAWGDLRRFRARLESEVRGVFPDLPPSHEVAQAVRSPLAFLDRLADEHERDQGDGPATVTEPTAPSAPTTSSSSAPAAATNGSGSPPGAGATEAAGAAANGSAVSDSAVSGSAGPGGGNAGAAVDAGPAVPLLDDPSMN